MVPGNSSEKPSQTRMRALTAWGGALIPSNLIKVLKEQVLRAAGALRALGRRPPPKELSEDERAALDRLVQAQQAEAEALGRNVDELERVLAGEIPVPQGMLLQLDGRVYPPGAWVRRTLRVIQGGAG